ncbi:MAG: regulatory protein RecX [Alphaproteobacteria bacterium]|nr:regulatory protein RecX [Alphaproteobacteria bacterium]
MPQPKKQRPPKVPTAQNLANIALYYLARFAASEASLRRVLQNRLRRAAMRLPDFAADKEAQTRLREAIEKIIEGHIKSGAVNDAAFAETKVRSLRRQGRSRRMIAQKLAVKGIQGDVLQAAFDQHEEGGDAEEIELKAALALARRRKLGPFRKVPADEDRRRKDFAALARAGFSMGIVRRALGAVPDDALFDE